MAKPKELNSECMRLRFYSELETDLNPNYEYDIIPHYLSYYHYYYIYTQNNTVSVRAFKRASVRAKSTYMLY